MNNCINSDLRNRYRRDWSRFYGAVEMALIQARKRLHITVPMLAKVIGCTPAHYQRMERGIHPFSQDQLRSIAQILRLRLCVIVDLQDIDILCRASNFNEDPQRARRLIERLYYMTRPVGWDCSAHKEPLASFYQSPNE
ncbi:MAG: helix-turn-helix domain-containing protein [Bacteroidales bacterium]|nr:helix-turn-helix domain-containing protein [Bacteroidales bacterium]